MPERWDDAALGAALTDLATHLDLPARDRLVDNVLATLPARRPAIAFGSAWRRARWAIAIVVLAALVTLGVSPDARAKVRDWFGAGGVRIEQAPSTSMALGPLATTAPAVSSLGLGDRTTLSEAATAFGAPVAVPHREGLREPDDVYFGRPPPDGQVSMVWHPGGALRPSASVSDIAILFAQFRGSLQGPILQKTARTLTRIQQVTVRGGEAWWLEGEPHEVAYLRPDGSYDASTLRLAGNTLVWARAGVTYRLESSFSLEDALAFANSVS